MPKQPQQAGLSDPRPAKERKMAKELITPKLTLKITLRERKDGSLFFRIESSRARHRARRYDYSYRHNDPFFIAAQDYLADLRNEGDQIKYTQVIRAHFDGQPDEKVFVFI